MARRTAVGPMAPARPPARDRAGYDPPEDADTDHGDERAAPHEQ